MQEMSEPARTLCGTCLLPRPTSGAIVLWPRLLRTRAAPGRVGITRTWPSPARWTPLPMGATAFCGHRHRHGHDLGTGTGTTYIAFPDDALVRIAPDNQIQYSCFLSHSPGFAKLCQQDLPMNMMYHSILRRSVQLLAALSLTVAAHAGPINADGTWQKFEWSANGVVEPMTFTCTGSCRLEITDAFLCGDVFSVALNGTPLANTSAPQACTDQRQEDPDLAFADPRFSSGTYNLNIAPHTLNVIAITNPYGSGGAFARIVPRTPDPIQPVPTLSQWSLLLLSALAAGFGAVNLKRRRTA